MADLGRYDEALRCFDKAIALYREYAEAWNRKGLALMALDRNIEADAAFAKAAMMEN